MVLREPGPLSGIENTNILAKDFHNLKPFCSNPGWVGKSLTCPLVCGPKLREIRQLACSKPGSPLPAGCGHFLFLTQQLPALSGGPTRPAVLGGAGVPLSMCHRQEAGFMPSTEATSFLGACARWHLSPSEQVTQPCGCTSTLALTFKVLGHAHCLTNDLEQAPSTSVPLGVRRGRGHSPPPRTVTW